MTRRDLDDDRKLCDAVRIEPEQPERPQKPWRLADRRKRRAVLARIDAALQSSRR